MDSHQRKIAYNLGKTLFYIQDLKKLTFGKTVEICSKKFRKHEVIKATPTQIIYYLFKENKLLWRKDNKLHVILNKWGMIKKNWENKLKHIEDLDLFNLKMFMGVSVQFSNQALQN